MDLYTLVVMLVIGLIVGFIARLIVPGPDPMGWLGTAVLGIVGSFVGGFLASIFFGGGATIQPSGWVGSIIGAIVVLVIWRQLNGGRAATV